MAIKVGDKITIEINKSDRSSDGEISEKPESSPFVIVIRLDILQKNILKMLLYPSAIISTSS